MASTLCVLLSPSPELLKDGGSSLMGFTSKISALCAGVYLLLPAPWVLDQGPSQDTTFSGPVPRPEGEER